MEINEFCNFGVALFVNLLIPDVRPLDRALVLSLDERSLIIANLSKSSGLFT